MKKSTLVTSMIVLITLCWASLLLMACRKEGIVAGSGTDTQTTTVKEMQAVPFDDTALRQEIASLKAQNAALANEKSARDFDYAALQSEYDKLKQQNANLEEQNKALSQQNSNLAEENSRLKNEIAQLNQAQGSTAVAAGGVVASEGGAGSGASEVADASGASKAPGMGEAAEGAEGGVAESTDGTGGALASGEAAEGAQVAGTAEAGEEVASADGKAKKEKKDKGEPGQVRNVLGFKVGPDMIDVEGTLAVMPHVFLIANMGLVETPEDFVEDKFPGHTSNHNIFSGKYNFLYDVMGGLGFNWQFNKLPAQPNVYLSSMLGPAWFLYKEDDDFKSKMYLLWRTSVGFDLTIYKDLLFTTDIGFDWMKDYDFTPRLAVGLLYRYNRQWSIFGRK